MKIIRHITLSLLVLVFSAGLLRAQQADTTLRVTYIANEGVLIAAGDRQVLIDAIHKPYSEAYRSTPPDIYADMLEGREPFDSVDLVLVSHVHGDHFHAGSVLKFLQKQTEAVLFTTPQAADSISSLAGGGIGTGQLERAHFEKGVKSPFSYEGIKVELMNIAHGSERFRWIENAGHLITMGGKTLLHIGDPAYGEYDFKQLDLLEENIDVAILPFWFLTGEWGREVITNYIQPGHIIAVHVSPGEGPGVTEDIRQYYPDAEVFTEPLQVAVFE